MTQKQQTELDRAIELATEHGIEVVAHGHRKADNAPIYCTTSYSDPERWHVVMVVGKRLVCDCKAGMHGKICAHRACVHMFLVVEASKKRAFAELIEAELERETAVRDNAVLYRSNDPISIFK